MFELRITSARWRVGRLDLRVADLWENSSPLTQWLRRLSPRLPHIKKAISGGLEVRWGLFIYVGIFTSLLFAQSKYPADSVLTSPNASLVEKTTILPIAIWQRISHNTNLLNCQFYPSCSQYGAITIKEKGVLKGLPMTADRIIRCNPSAYFNHIQMHGEFHKQDYRLVDHPQSEREISNSKSPVLAGLLSALLPGAGRVYAGRWFDGLMGFFMVYLTTTSAYESSKREDSLSKVFSYSLTGIFYTGEIYGAYRSAKYYQRQ